jgi:hypothetical protein
MALKAALPDAVTRFSLEDVFVDGDAGGDKLAWVSGWRKLPHLTQEVEKLFDYPQRFAEDVFARIEDALRRRASDGDASADVQTGRLFIFTADDLQADSDAALIPDLPNRHVALADSPRLLSDRREGRCLLSYQTPGGWVAIAKSILTEVLGEGRDAKIVGLPPAAGEALTLMCRDLVVTANRRYASPPAESA